MKEHLKLLGLKVRDVVTGFEGTVDTIAFDLYGCVQAIVRGAQNKKSPAEAPEARWFDTKRLTVLSRTPVMAAPTFAVVPGGSEKPAQPERPLK